MSRSKQFINATEESGVCVIEMGDTVACMYQCVCVCVCVWCVCVRGLIDRSIDIEREALLCLHVERNKLSLEDILEISFLPDSNTNTLKTQHTLHTNT
jgi:hypothetical protein